MDKSLIHKYDVSVHNASTGSLSVDIMIGVEFLFGGLPYPFELNMN